MYKTRVSCSTYSSGLGKRGVYGSSGCGGATVQEEEKEGLFKDAQTHIDLPVSYKFV